MIETRILIADDLPEHIKVFTDILLIQNPNFKIYAASNGKNAFELAKIKIPHLIIMDWDMPVMNGLEAITALKANELTKEIPIIIASGLHTDSEALKEALSIGAVDFLRKPVDKTELIARVQSMLRLVESHQEVIKQKELNYKQEIEYKTLELSAHALSIAKQNDFLLFLINELKKLQEVSNAQSKKLIYGLIENTNKQINENSWEDFEQQFDKVYSNFYKVLTSKYPTLTSGERKLCSLLRMNLSSKEIASIIFQEPSSVDVARYRLRQKLGLEKEENLVAFIMSLEQVV